MNSLFSRSQRKRERREEIVANSPKLIFQEWMEWRKREKFIKLTSLQLPF